MSKTVMAVDEPPGGLPKRDPVLIIEMADKDDFIRSAVGMFGHAIILTRRCIDILSTQHNANVDWIDAMIFYNRYVGQLVEHSISGKQPTEPEIMVAEAIDLYRLEFLGMKAANRMVELQILAARQEWFDVVSVYGGPAD